MTLYPELNKKIKDILRVSSEAQNLYAAERIEQLESLLGKALIRMQMINGDIDNCAYRIGDCPNHALINDIKEALE